MKYYEEKICYYVARHTLDMGDCFLWRDTPYIISNRGDINLENGCSESIDGEAEVEKICPKLVYTRSASGRPYVYTEE